MKPTFLAIVLPEAAWDPPRVRSFDMILVEGSVDLPEHPFWWRPLGKGVYLTLSPQHLN